MSGRDAEIAAFLARTDWAEARRTPLAGDASFRRYERLGLGDRRAVLMDAPPGREDVRPFVAIDRHLQGLGYSVPTILAADEARGLLLLEDLGDDTFGRLLGQGAAAEPLYALAVDLLIDLHGRPERQASPDWLRLYDGETMVKEARLFTEWYLPGVTGRPTAKDSEASFTEAWRAMVPLLDRQPRTLMMRDFFADNLMRVAGRDGLRACGLLDFQDAVAGPPAYDLVSLLEDARRDFPPALIAAMLARYRRGMTGLDPVEFEAAYALMGAQRHVRVLGVFTRLWRRDGKPGYLAHIPRLWRLLENALTDPALAPVAAWFAREVPAGLRVVPSTETAR